MADDFSEEQAYLKKHRLAVYFEDSIQSLLVARRRPSPATPTAKIDVNAHLRDYFTQVKREGHIIGREYAFINGTPHNRRAFLTHIWSKCETSVVIPNTLKEMHNLMLSICPDFPYSILETSATLIEDNELSLTIDYVTFLRAFQLRFLYEEFIHESQQFFRSFSHRLTCHVPTAEISIPQQDNNQRQVLYDAFQNLVTLNICFCPPLHILEDALLSTDRQQLTHQKFLIQLAKNEKLTRLIGREPTVLKQPRPIPTQQRPIIEPIPSIQDETKVLLASLSTPTTRISSPIAPITLLPPLPNQQALVREKPIRQNSAASMIQTNLKKRPDSATSVQARASSAKSATPIATIIKQEISETDSEVESRSSDTDT